MLPDIVITSNTLGYGGAERQRVLLANGLRELGHNVCLRLLQAAGPLASELHTEVEVDLRPWWDARPAWSGGAAGLVSGTTNTEVAHAFLLRHVRRAVDFWAVAAHTPPVSRRPTYGPLLRHLIPAADLLISLTDQHAAALQAHGRLNGHVISIANGIPAGSAPAPMPSFDRTRLVFIGRLTPQKGLDLLLQGLSQVSATSWHLEVVGDGPERRNLESLVDELRLSSRVTFQGFRQDVRSVLSNNHALVVPSRNEAFPLVLLEAMAAGRGAIVTRAGAMAEMLGGPSCGLVLPDAVSAWPNVLNGLISMADPPLADWGQNARTHFVAHYEAQRMVRAYSEALREGVP